MIWVVALVAIVLFLIAINSDVPHKPTPYIYGEDS